MQQKPVRFYITQDADEPVVRTVPVGARRPEPVLPADAPHVTETPASASSAPTPVRKIVPATRRTGGTPGR